MMDNFTSSLNIAFLNCCGQTGFNLSKQMQIQSFMQKFEIDILNLQETHVDDNTFSECNFISKNFEILRNNSSNNFGTSSLVKNTFVT